MNTAEKVIKREIARIDKKLESIKEIFNATPASRIFEIRQEARKIMEQHDGDYQKMQELIKPLADEEKKQFAIMKKQSDSKLIDRELKLEQEKRELENALFYIGLRSR